MRADPAFVLELIKQGGLLVVLLVVLYFYRRDYLALLHRRDDMIASLTRIIEQTTAIMTSNHALGERLARSVEHLSERLDRAND